MREKDILEKINILEMIGIEIEIDIGKLLRRKSLIRKLQLLANLLIVNSLKLPL